MIVCQPVKHTIHNHLIEVKTKHWIYWYVTWFLCRILNSESTRSEIQNLFKWVCLKLLYTFKKVVLLLTLEYIHLITRVNPQSLLNCQVADIYTANTLAKYAWFSSIQSLVIIKLLVNTLKTCLPVKLECLNNEDVSTSNY